MIRHILLLVTTIIPAFFLASCSVPPLPPLPLSHPANPLAEEAPPHPAPSGVLSLPLADPVGERRGGEGHDHSHHGGRHAH